MWVDQFCAPELARAKNGLCRKFLTRTKRAWQDGRGFRRKRIELLRWAQFARRAHLTFADHMHDFDFGAELLRLIERT